MKINGVSIGQATFSYWPFKHLPLLSMGPDNFNLARETLLNILINQDYSRFFRLKCIGNIPKTKNISLFIQVTEWEKEESITIHSDYLPLQNIFFRDSLPFAVNQESPYIPQILEDKAILYSVNNLRILKNQQAIYINNTLQKKMEPNLSNFFADQLDQGIFWSCRFIKNTIKNDLFLALECSNESKVVFANNQAIASCTMGKKYTHNNPNKKQSILERNHHPSSD